MHLKLSVFGLIALLAACSHPLEIVGEGDILSASGNRDCLLENHQAGLDNCALNLVVQDYQETYFAVPRPGSQFIGWRNYCTQGNTGDQCSFSAKASVVAKYWGETMLPLVAVFAETSTSGYNSLFIGHSFFDPFAKRMGFQAQQAGFLDHSQNIVFSGGAGGAPEALWNNAGKRAAIQAHLDTGDVELFGMTYFPTYPGLDGYRNWIDYALAKNPGTRFFIALPWVPYPTSYTAAQYANLWTTIHESDFHPMIDSLRSEYPNVAIYCIPYGQSAQELRTRFSDGQLPEVSLLTGNKTEALFTDDLSHPGDILVALGELVWLNAIYGVDLNSHNYDTGYQVDLKGIAQAIMDNHDPDYNAPW